MNKPTYTQKEIDGMYNESGLARHNKGLYDEGCANAVNASIDANFEAAFDSEVERGVVEAKAEKVQLDFTDINRLAAEKSERDDARRAKARCDADSRAFNKLSASGHGDRYAGY